PRKSYYELLEVSPDATSAEIHKAYKKKALQHHPDKNPGRVAEATELFKAIGEAYLCLRDPQKRAAYDSGGLDSWSGAPSSPTGGDGFTFGMAKDLFRETFGEEFANRLAETSAAMAQKAASVLGAASEACSQSEPVKGVVGAQLKSLADEAEAQAQSWERAVAARRQELQAVEEEQRKQETLRAHEGARLQGLEAEALQSCGSSLALLLCFACGAALQLWLETSVHNTYWALRLVGPVVLEKLPMACVAGMMILTRRSRLCTGLWLSCCFAEVFYASQVLSIARLLNTLAAVLLLRFASKCWGFLQLTRQHEGWRRQDAEDTLNLEADRRRAHVAHRGAQQRMQEARVKAEEARREVESVALNGASLSYALKAGSHLVGKAWSRFSGHDKGALAYGS
ncbi:unnamed protein product, partial [Effrenium voratum]